VKALRILMVSEWSPNSFGGVSSQVALLAKWLEKRGHSVIVMHKEGESGYNTVRVKSIVPFEHYVVPPCFWEVKKTISRIEPDIVHVHHSFTPLSVLAVRACAKLGLPCVLTNHSLPPAGDVDCWLKISYIAPYRWLLRPTIVTAVSVAAANFIQEFLGLKTEVKVIPNAVDTERFKPGLAERSDCILYVGRLVRRKGVHVLIEAFKILQRRGFDVKLVIGGKGYMEPLLKFMASDTDNIVFLGAVSEEVKPALFAGAKVFVLPSLAGESFGVVLLEALSSGTPVVATRVGGIPEIVADGEEGFIIKPGNPEELAEAVAILLKSPDVWLKMSLKARRKAVEKYSIDKIGRLYEETYFEALELVQKVRILVE